MTTGVEFPYAGGGDYGTARRGVGLNARAACVRGACCTAPLATPGTAGRRSWQTTRHRAPGFTFTKTGAEALTAILATKTTGKSLTVTVLPMTAGQALMVDCAAQTVKLAGSNRMGYFSGDFFALDPGNNTLALTLSGVALTSIGTGWVKRWL